MMFESFTDFARQCVVGALREAEALGHPAIGTEHLLLSLAKMPGLASVSLKRHEITPTLIASEVAERTHYVPEREALAAIGIDLNELIRKAEETFGAGVLTDKPRTTELIKSVFEQAEKESADMESSYEGRAFVGTEHLLLGLLRQGEGVGCDILVAHGVDLEQARSELKELMQAGVKVRKSVDDQPAELTARKMLHLFQQLREEDRNSVMPFVREMLQAQHAAWARVLDELGRRPTDALVADYVATVEAPITRAEGAFTGF